MIAKGRVVNGVVVFDEGTSLPEGTVVSIVPAGPRQRSPMPTT